MLNRLNLRLMNWQAKARWKRIKPAIPLSAEAVIADIGPGGGFYTAAFANAAAKGEIYAVDVESRNLGFIRRHAERLGFAERLVLVLGEEEDCLLPEDRFDLIFCSNAYHHMQSPVVYFRSVARALKPAGKAVVIDYDGTSGWMPKHGHSTSPEKIREDLKLAGLKLSAQHDQLPGQSFQVFSRQ